MSLPNPTRAHLALLASSGALLLALVSGGAVAQNPSTDGDWTQPFGLPLIAIHSAILPSGKVLLFSAEHGVPGIHGWVLDPDTLALTNVDPPAGWNLDCAGHSFLPDGRLLVAGGTLSFQPLRGTKLAYTFHPWLEQWTQIEDMREGRWYPTNVTLPDGSVITLSGRSTTPLVQNPDIERWDPLGSSNWELLGQKTLANYPLLHVMPGGLVFMAGPDPLTETYNPQTNTWTPVASMLAPARYEAPSVLLPPTLDRVMVSGGYDGQNGQPTNSTEIIDLSEPSPAWALTSHMAAPRMEHDAVILPDGKVLVVGGASHNSNSNPQPVMVPEIFDPQTATWDPVAPHQVPRMYHSTAILLPDARVLVAGADNQASGEIYSPAYLFQPGPRPAITSAPLAIAYGTPFTLSFTSGTPFSRVVLIRLSSVTHSVNMGQRYVALAETTQGGGTLSVPAPADGAVAPPGYYMLFVVDGDGVPSVSKMVRVVEGFGDYVDVGNALAGTAGLPVLSGSGVMVGGSLVTFTLQNGLPGSSAILGIGLSRIDLPIAGGVLVPSPDLLIEGLVIGPTGSTSWSLTWPLGLPTAFNAWLQYWFPDAGGPQGWAASNGLCVTAP